MGHLVRVLDADVGSISQGIEALANQVCEIIAAVAEWVTEKDPNLGLRHQPRLSNPERLSYSQIPCRSRP